jgi:DNA-binding transcriptional MerR regulator
VSSPGGAAPPQRTAAGYRAYDAAVLPRLAFIRAAQAVDLSLPEIREVIGIRERGAAPCRHVLGLIERRRAEVQARIRELQRLEQELAHLTEQSAQLDPAECDPAGICKVIPTERARATPSAPSVRSATLSPTGSRKRSTTSGPAPAQRPSVIHIEA